MYEDTFVKSIGIQTTYQTNLMPKRVPALAECIHKGDKPSPNIAASHGIQCSCSKQFVRTVISEIQFLLAISVLADLHEYIESKKNTQV